MAVLPDRYHPFRKKNIYEKLDIGPYAGDEEIKDALRNLSLETLPAEERKKQTELLKKELKALKQNHARVQLNTLYLEKVDIRVVGERLKHLPNLETEKIELPKPSLSQVFIEGNDIETSEQDFQSQEADPTMEFNFDDVKEVLTREIAENEIFFDT